MKGTTIIQLFDGITKKIIEEIKHDNYITDAINQYYLKLQKYHTCNIGQGLNLKFGDFAQGIILFENNMPSSGCYLPRSTDVATGYAYNTYSGSDVKRGSLNALESGDITKGYRKVWDFGTGIAIGNISAVALTTANAGSVDLNSFELNTVQQSTFSQYRPSSDSPTTDRIHYNCIDISDNYILYTASPYNTGNFIFNYSDFWIVPFNSSKIKYSEILKTEIRVDKNVSNSDRVYNPVLMDTPTGYTRTSCPTIDDVYFYICFYKAGVGFKLHRYLCSNGDFVDELTYDFVYSAVPYSFKVSSDYIIWSSGANLYWLDKETLIQYSISNVAAGRNVRGIGFSKKYPSTICIYADSASNVEGISDYYFAYVSLTNKTVWGQGCNNISYITYDYTDLTTACVYVDEPLYIFATNNSSNTRYSGSRLNTALSGRTLSTINNLPSTIIKEANQVLKVIYDITW